MELEGLSTESQEIVLAVAEEYELEVETVLDFMRFNEHVGIGDVEEEARKFVAYWFEPIAYQVY